MRIRILPFVVLSAVLILFTNTTHAKKRKTLEGYGKTKWGMSLEEVKKYYPKIEYKGSGDYFYKTTIAEVPVRVDFNLEDEKLRRVTVHFLIKEESSIPSVRSTILEMLKKKYGKPIKLSYSTHAWALSRTRVFLVYLPNSLEVRYSEHKENQKKPATKEDLDKL